MDKIALGWKIIIIGGVVIVVGLALNKAYSFLKEQITGELLITMSRNEMLLAGQVLEKTKAGSAEYRRVKQYQMEVERAIKNYSMLRRRALHMAVAELHRERIALEKMLQARPDLRKKKAVSKVKPKRKKTVSRRKTIKGQGGETMEQITGAPE